MSGNMSSSKTSYEITGQRILNNLVIVQNIWENNIHISKGKKTFTNSRVLFKKNTSQGKETYFPTRTSREKNKGRTFWSFLKLLAAFLLPPLPGFEDLTQGRELAFALGRRGVVPCRALFAPHGAVLVVTFIIWRRDKEMTLWLGRQTQGTVSQWQQEALGQMVYVTQTFCCAECLFT